MVLSMMRWLRVLVVITVGVSAFAHDWCVTTCVDLVRGGAAVGAAATHAHCAGSGSDTQGPRASAAAIGCQVDRDLTAATVASKRLLVAVVSLQSSSLMPAASRVITATGVSAPAPIRLASPTQLRI